MGSAGHSGAGGQAGVAMPPSQVGPPRRGSGWAPRGTTSQAGVPRPRPLLAMGWIWRWDAGRSRGSFGKKSPAEEKHTERGTGEQAASSCLGELGGGGGQGPFGEELL